MKISVEEMRGLIRGQCLPADMFTGEYLPEYLVRKFSELQQKLDAIAAENASLKSNLMYWDAEDPELPYDSPLSIACECGLDYGTEFEVQVAAKMPNLKYRVSGVSEYRTEIELIEGSLPKTPATDAYLNSMHAEGADMFATSQRAKIGKPHQNDAVLAYSARVANEFANKLRTAGQTAKDGE
nr:hypothetical protein [Pantoea cypripedii]